ncbi:MAG: hypothetical protein Q8P17_02525 [bacterium]|nr:hypothetical protein [bacterium]
MEIGTKVQIDWNSGITGHKDVEQIYLLGDSIMEVVHYDGVSINQVLLPEGVTLPGFSKRWADKGHFIVLHNHHIKPAG